MILFCFFFNYLEDIVPACTDSYFLLLFSLTLSSEFQVLLLGSHRMRAGRPPSSIKALTFSWFLFVKLIFLFAFLDAIGLCAGNKLFHVKDVEIKTHLPQLSALAVSAWHIVGCDTTIVSVRCNTNAPRILMVYLPQPLTTYCKRVFWRCGAPRWPLIRLSIISAVRFCRAKIYSKLLCLWVCITARNKEMAVGLNFILAFFGILCFTRINRER